MFASEPHSKIDKSFKLSDLDLDIHIEFDYDDVNHERVDFIAGWLLGVLNERRDELVELLDRFDTIQRKRWEAEKE
jgi:hypothetical protein